MCGCGSETLLVRVVEQQDQQALEWNTCICKCLFASLLRHRHRCAPCGATMSSAHYDRLVDAEAGEEEGLRDAPPVPG